MKCPVKDCGGRLRVCNTRQRPGVVARQRKCMSCGHSVTTWETFKSVFGSFETFLNVTKPTETTNSH